MFTFCFLIKFHTCQQVFALVLKQDYDVLIVFLSWKGVLDLPLISANKLEVFLLPFLLFLLLFFTPL